MNSIIFFLRDIELRLSVKPLIQLTVAPKTKRGRPEVLREVKTHWSHIEQRGCDQHVLGEVRTHWWHLEQREGDTTVWRAYSKHSR